MQVIGSTRMENIQLSEVKPGYYMFGNKGAVWSNKAHLSKNGISGTLCGTPMLSNNHARLEGVKEIGCEKCIEVYTRETATATPAELIEMLDRLYAFMAENMPDLEIVDELETLIKRAKQ